VLPDRTIGATHFLGSDSLNKSNRQTKVVSKNPRGSSNRIYPNRITTVNDGLRKVLHCRFVPFFPSTSFFSFLSREKSVESIRINPKIPNRSPDKKGRKPAPGAWKFPSFKLIDPAHIPIPKRTQISPSARTYFFIESTYPDQMFTIGIRYSIIFRALFFNKPKLIDQLSHGGIKLLPLLRVLAAGHIGLFYGVLL
jgi:hypothetical protein